jgi:hypothetical protein
MGEMLLSASNHKRLNVLLGAEQQQGMQDRWRAGDHIKCPSASNDLSKN